MTTGGPPTDPRPSSEEAQSPRGGDATGSGTSRRRISETRRADLELLLVAVLWGVNFSVVKWGLDSLEPLAFNALRFPLAAVVVLLVLRSRGALTLPRKEDWPALVALALLGHLVYQVVFIYGLDLTLAGNASVLLATSPAWTVVIAALRGHERPGPAVWAGVGASLAGVALVVAGGSRGLSLAGGTVAGDLLMLAAAALWAFYTVEGRGLIDRYGPLAVTSWTLTLAVLPLVALGLPDLASGELAALDAGGWLAVGYSGVLAIGTAYVLWYRGVRTVGSTRTAVYGNLVPVVAVAVAWLWLGETLSTLQLVGAAVTIGGVALTRLRRRRPSPTPPLE